MANTDSPFQPAIDELEKELAEVERQRNGLLTTINVLRAKAGLQPRPEGSSDAGSDGSTPPGGGGSPIVRHDSFFGKKMGTAVREFLEMRFASSGNRSNPAKPREIFDALKQGGFVFETKDDGVAIISLRNMLRKNTQQFQKLPNGTYGLRTWYPGAKKPKAQADDDTDEPEVTESGAAPKKAAL